MIVDASALVAIVLREPGYDGVRLALADDPRPAVGSPTLVETSIVLVRRIGSPARTYLARLLDDAEIEIVPFGEEHWPVALDAFSRFGKGRHAAGLNFGDCLAYAIARVADEPLLCVGDDFAQTDLEIVQH